MLPSRYVFLPDGSRREAYNMGQPVKQPSPAVKVERFARDESRGYYVLETSAHNSLASRTPTVSGYTSTTDGSATPTDSDATPSETPRYKINRNLRTTTLTSEMESKILASKLEALPSVTFKRSGRMSFAQERLWFLNVYLQDQTTYNVTMAYQFTGPLRTGAMKKAFQAVIDRHESLRTAFFADPLTHEPQQGVYPDGKMPFVVKTLNSKADIDREFQAVSQHVYDLENGEMIKATLLTTSSTSHILILGFHHIAFDGFSSQVFIKDFATSYSGLTLAPLQHQYLDFSIKQRMQREHGMEREVSYWKSEYPTLPPILPLFEFAKVKTRKLLTEYRQSIFEKILPEKSTAALKSASLRLGATAFHLHLATLQVLLHRFLQVSDLCIGIIDANKKDPQHFDTLGFFVNLLPLHFQVESSQTLANLVQNTQDKIFAGLEHSQLPFDALLDELKVPRSADINPMFQLVFNYKMGSVQKVPVGDCEAEMLRLEDVKNPYDLTFEVETFPNGTATFAIKGQEYLYSKTDLEMLFDIYTNLLESIYKDPSLPISQYDLFEASSARKALQLGKGERIDLNETRTISQIFTELAASVPSELAVSDDLGNRITYGEMLSMIMKISSCLAQAGVFSGSFVAVYCEPTADIISLVLAIMRLNAVYVPFDTRNPRARLQLVLNDCKPTVIICDASTVNEAHKLDLQDAHILESSELQKTKADPVEDVSQPKSPACAIYTSGSTGTPKGVLLQHAALVNNVVGMKYKYGLDEEVILQQNSLGFDLSLAQMLQVCVSGGRIVVASNKTRGDPVRLANLMFCEGITYSWATPSEYSFLLRYSSETIRQCKAWRFAVSAGEALPQSLVTEIDSMNIPGLRLVDAYGPSEGTIVATTGEIDIKSQIASGDVLTIGRPMPNYSIYILSNDLQPVPAGVAGEVVIGGAGVAMGYLGNHELTNSKFLPNPYASKADSQRGWNMMYRTGDRGRLLPDGRIVYLGRIDDDTQIKLRGVRIELAEIANTIMRQSCGTVIESAVSLRGKGEGAFLVAFIVLSTTVKIKDVDEYLEKLRRGLQLPSAMTPSRIIALEHLPLNASGKFDKRGLQIIPIPALNYDVEVARTLTENTLSKLWKLCLPGGLCPGSVPRTSDFFGAGGNSLLMIRLQAEIRDVMGIEVALHQLFTATTLQGMARVLDRVSLAKIVADIDWDRETSIETSLYEIRQPESSRPIGNSNIEILLTGSTGFVGSDILERLVNDPDVSRIHCVAIRQDPRVQRQLKIGSPKIIPYYGDLSSPGLGLSDSQFEALSNRIDRIIHNGADVSFLKSYQTLKRTNVEATKELIRLALPRKIPFHFISTTGVGQFRSGSDLPEISASAFPPPSDGSMGYAATKWVSELHLERVSNELNLQVVVHRPANVTGPGSEGTNMIANVVGYSVKTGLVPKVHNLHGRIQFVSLDKFSRGVLVAVQEPITESKSLLKFVNHCGEKTVFVAELRSYLEIEFDCKLQEVDMNTWLVKAGEAGLKPMFRIAIPDVLGKSDRMICKGLSKGSL